jgi:O-antigen ligase
MSTAFRGVDGTLPGSRWIEVARWSTIVAACAVMVSPPLANVAMALMLIGLLASGQAWPRLRHACSQPLGVATLVLVGVIAVAMLWADVPWVERGASFWSWRKPWMIPITLALFGPLAWKRRLVAAYVGACGVAVLVSFGIVVVTGRLSTTVEDLAGSMLRNHSAQSMFFATAAFLALWLLTDPRLARRWRWACGAFAALFVLNMAFVTPGRSGLLALAAMLVVLAALNLRDWRNAIAAAVLAAVLAGAMALSPLARDRLASAMYEWQNAATLAEPTPIGIRAVLYQNTLELVRERPWFGTGTGGFGPAYAAHVRDKYNDWRVLPTVDPHSQYLFFLAEQGIFGLVAFLGFILAALKDRGDGTRARVVAIGMLLAWCSTSLLSSHFKTFSEGHLLAIFLGAMLARPVPRLDDGRSSARLSE